MYRSSILAVAAFVFIGALTACDNPVEDDDHEDEHAEAAGLVLISDGDELLRVENAEVSDTLVVPVGESIDVDVEFLDEDGDEIHAEDFDEEFTLAWEISDESVFTVTSSGRWTFSVEGGVAGEATLTMKLMHGGHPDFTTPGIPVRVE